MFADEEMLHTEGDGARTEGSLPIALPHFAVQLQNIIPLEVVARRLPSVMKLVPAGGNPRMQRALTHRTVQKIALILSHHPELLALIAIISKFYDQHNQAGLEQDLERLRLSQSRPSDTRLIPLTHIIELAQGCMIVPAA